VPCGPRSTSIRSDVVDVEHGGLRAVEVHVVEIEADARLEAGDRDPAGRRRG
jgi:hypothetical protein